MKKLPSVGIHALRIHALRIKYVSKNDLISLDKNGNVSVHPSLLYVYLNSGKDV